MCFDEQSRILSPRDAIPVQRTGVVQREESADADESPISERDLEKAIGINTKWRYKWSNRYFEWMCTGLGVGPVIDRAFAVAVARLQYEHEGNKVTDDVDGVFGDTTARWLEEKHPRGDALLSDAQVIAAIAENSAKAYDPAWVQKLSCFVQAMGNATGAFNRATVEGIARFQELADQDVTGVVDDALIASFVQNGLDEPTKIGAGEREEKSYVDTNDAERAPDKKLESERKKGRYFIHEEAVKAKGGVASWSEYQAKYVGTDFFGRKDIVGHPLFIERIDRAKAYLRNRFAGKTDAEIGALLGLTGDTSRSVDYPTAGMTKIGYHWYGFAVDIRAGTNPYALESGESDEDSDVRLAAYQAIGRAAQFSGKGEAFNDESLKYFAQEKTTEELVALLRDTSDAVSFYAKVAGVESAIEEHLSKEETPAEVRDKGVAWWVEQSEADLPLLEQEQLVDRKEAEDGSTHYEGFTDLHPDLVIAMRDAAGLAWGATDFESEANGDFQHFDGRTISEGKSIIDEGKRMKEDLKLG